jgi:hypothetical protein
MSHLASTVATETRCPRCHAPLLAALDEGLHAQVDIKPLADPQAEIAALMQGRWTYTHTHWGHLVHRDATRIAGNTLRGPIHAEHRCQRNEQLTLDTIGA